MKNNGYVIMAVVVVIGMAVSAWGAETLKPQINRDVTNPDTGSKRLRASDFVVPDLICSISGPPAPKAGDTVKPFTITIRNSGPGIAGPQKTVFGCTGMNCVDFRCAECVDFKSEFNRPGIGSVWIWSVPELKPNETRAFTFQPVNGAARWEKGSYGFTCTVNRDHLVKEGVEGEKNNSSSIGYTVQ